MRNAGVEEEFTPIQMGGSGGGRRTPLLVGRSRTSRPSVSIYVEEAGRRGERNSFDPLLPSDLPGITSDLHILTKIPNPIKLLLPTATWSNTISTEISPATLSGERKRAKTHP
jgi:hypothetical protein